MVHNAINFRNSKKKEHDVEYDSPKSRRLSIPFKINFILFLRDGIWNGWSREEIFIQLVCWAKRMENFCSDSETTNFLQLLGRGRRKVGESWGSEPPLNSVKRSGRKLLVSFRGREKGVASPPSFKFDSRYSR